MRPNESTHSAQMIKKGLKIYHKNGQDAATLQTILSMINQGNLLDWAILYLYGKGTLGDNISIVDFEEKIQLSPVGVHFNWKELNTFAAKLDQIYDITIVGCENKVNIHKYNNFSNEKMMYESCDVTIEMFDGGYWQIFSNDTLFLKRLSNYYQITEWISTDKLTHNG